LDDGRVLSRPQLRALGAFPYRFAAELDYATSSAGKISSVVIASTGICSIDSKCRALRTTPKMTDVRTVAIFGLVGGDQLFATLNAGYPKRGTALGTIVAMVIS
jgi:hypothetical protein